MGDYIIDAEYIVEMSLPLSGEIIDGAIIEDSNVRIIKPGTYRLTGELQSGQVIVDCNEDDELTLILNGATISNEEGPAILISNAKNVCIHIEGGSENNLVGEIQEIDNRLDGVIFSEVDLLMNGSGVLNIKGSSSNGIASKSNIRLNGGIYNIEVDKHGIEGKGSVVLFANEADIISGKDGIHSDLNITVLSGKYKIEASGEGMEAQVVEIHDGNIIIQSEEDGINASSSDENMEVYIEINGGKVIIDGKGDKADGLDSNGDIYINGGTVIASSTIEGNKHTALDYDDKGIITGGTFIGTGGASEVIQNFSPESTQGSIMVILTDWEDGELKLLNEEGIEIISYTPVKKYQGITISSKEIVKGKNYTLVVDSNKIEVNMVNNIYQ